MGTCNSFQRIRCVQAGTSAPHLQSIDPTILNHFAFWFLAKLLFWNAMLHHNHNQIHSALRIRPCCTAQCTNTNESFYLFSVHSFSLIDIHIWHNKIHHQMTNEWMMCANFTLLYLDCAMKTWQDWIIFLKNKTQK